MKILRHLYLSIFILVASACDLNEILVEEPKDFLSPENSFTDRTGFEAGLANIYLSVRTNLYANVGNWQDFDMLGLDLDFTVRRLDNDTYNEFYFWNQLNADHSVPDKWWGYLYNWVFQANTIIDRSESSFVTWESEEVKNQIVAEARFLRAFAYHFLANIYGGVPLVLNETDGPKFDYERATQNEVYVQCKADLEFAIQHMQTVDQLKGGRAPRAAAYHLLSEINISLGDYDGAIAAASAVIDDPNFHLMTTRFGKWTNFQFNGYDYQGPNQPWGDVYWDLFRVGNMNWLEGNNESIWNVEFDVNLLGGGNVNQLGGNFNLEGQWAGPNWHSGTSDINGVRNWLKDTLSGRPVGAIAPTGYVSKTIWEFKNDWDNDIRNSQYNIQRYYFWTNPASAFYGDTMKLDNVAITSRFLRLTEPSFKKGITTVHNGLGVDANGQNHDWGRIFKDWYVMRLSETYLLRAEAYHLKGDNTNAALDINVVRNRAQATPVVAGEIDMDLILDERARELYMEEFRLNTLTRTGKLSEYLMKYNESVFLRGYVLDDHLNKFPIPNSEIQANKRALLQQNPGY